MLLFDEVADDLVVEVRDGLPLNALLEVLLLLRLESQLDEQLLQLLVAVVYAELFKAGDILSKYCGLSSCKNV